MNEEHNSNIPAGVVGLTELIVNATSRILGSSSQESAFFPSQYDFKRDHKLEDRCAESRRIRRTYPDRIPVICQKAKGSTLKDIDKHKYLVPIDLTVGQFLYVIRKRMKLEKNAALFVFINGGLPPCSQLLSTVYEQSKDRDGFLYVTYSSENTFG